jgi:ABC-type multidrug transport system fused ATPase/permease subunit
MATRMPEPQATDQEPTIGRLVADATSDLSALIRSEIELAKSELRFSVKAGGIGAALFAVAAFLGIIALIMLSIALAFLLAKLPFIGLFLGFLIVFLLYAIAAAICALIGKRKLSQVHAPERTIATMKDNTQVLSR